MKAWGDLSKSDLEKLVEKHSGPELAKMFGVHHNTVYAKLVALGITKRYMYIDFDPSKEELGELYKTMTIDQLAAHYGVSASSVKRKLREHRTPEISSAQRLKGKKKSLSHRLAMGASARASGIRAGEKNGNWKGGVSTGNARARSRASYYEWKTAVLTASGWKCSSCGVEHGACCPCCGHITYLHAHHIESFADNEAKRYDPTNGIALCKKCHMKEHRSKTA